MRLFGRREPLHVKLAREGGIELDPGRERQGPAWDAAGINGIHRPREWDCVTTVRAEGLSGERASFVALGPGRLVSDAPTAPLGLLAAAVDRDLEPPYRAEAVRRDGDLWAVAARHIEVVELPDVEGEELELVVHDGETSLLVDGQRAFGTVPTLERPEHVVRAWRIAGDEWEVEVKPL